MSTDRAALRALAERARDAALGLADVSQHLAEQQYREAVTRLAPAALLELLEDAARWEVVRDTSYICSTGPQSGYYLSGSIIPGSSGPMPTVTGAADALRVAAGRLRP